MYLVTEKVWESDSTDASDEEPIPKPPQSKPAKSDVVSQSFIILCTFVIFNENSLENMIQKHTHTHLYRVYLLESNSMSVTIMILLMFIIVIGKQLLVSG